MGEMARRISLGDSRSSLGWSLPTKRAVKIRANWAIMCSGRSF
uniref:Uncharacterized protein n=1 Tax=Musa acuminata subsp. malaccensis TaxID=214687 RepID=A0A804IHV3_MUSAM